MHVSGHNWDTAYLARRGLGRSNTVRTIRRTLPSFSNLPFRSGKSNLGVSLFLRRGLLREIEETPSCSPKALADLGVEVTCVGSSGIGGSFLTSNLEELVAASSYLPLLGKLGRDTKGDGIVPLDVAFMGSPATRVIVDECSLTGAPVRHSHVLPTPWNLIDGFAPSIKLPTNFVSYVSEGVLPQWSRFVR